MKKLRLTILGMLLLCNGLFSELSEFEGLNPLTLQEAQTLALANNSTLGSKQAIQEAAKWNKTSSLAALLPSLSFGASLFYTDPATLVTAGSQSYSLNKDMRTMSLNLSQPLFLGGKLYQAYKIAGVSEEMAELAYRNQRNTLFADTETKYLNVLQLMEVYRLSQADLQAARENLDIASLKLENGLISQTDYLRFQSTLAGKEVSDLQAYTALQLALRDFGNYLGLAELRMPAPLNLPDFNPQIDKLASFNLDQTKALGDRALELTLQRNLTLKTLDKTEELSQRALRIARAGWLPSLMLTGSRQYKENGLDRYEFTPANQLLLSFSLPLLPGLGNYASVQKAKEEARKAALENKTATDGIKLGLEAATLSLVSAARQSQSAALAMRYNEQLYAQLQERFRLNMLSAKELLDAELMLSAARLNYNNALYGFLKARSSLRQNLAVETDTELSQLLDI